jgi:hypothetical protein
VITALLEQFSIDGRQAFYPKSVEAMVWQLSSFGHRGIGSWSMPSDYCAALAEIYVALARPDGAKSDPITRPKIYAPFDMTLPLAFELARRGEGVAVEIESEEAVYFAKTVAWVAEWPLSVRLGSPVAAPTWVEDGRLDVFQGAVCVAPFGRRYDKKLLASDRFHRFPEGLFQGELAAVAHTLAQSPQFAFVVVPEGVLFRTAGPDRDYKARLLRERRISHIIKMPRGMFPSSSIETTVLVLGGDGVSDRVRICDARKYYQPKDRLSRKQGGWDSDGLNQLIHDVTSTSEHDEARFVSFDEFERNDFNLSVERYLKSKRQQQIEGILSNLPTYALGDVAEIIRPQLVKRTEDGDLELRELSPADLTDEGTFALPESRFYFDASDERRASRQMVQVGDVLLTVRGSIGRVGLVTRALIDAFKSAGDNRVAYLCASQAFVILRLRRSSPLTDPAVLRRFLASPLGQQLLFDVTAGTAVPNIAMGDLKC